MDRGNTSADKEPEVISVSSGSYHPSRTECTFEATPGDHLYVTPSIADAHDMLSVNTDREPISSVVEHEHEDMNISFLFSDEDEPPMQKTSKADAEERRQDDATKVHRTEKVDRSPPAVYPPYPNPTLPDKATDAELDLRLNELSREREAILNMTHNGMAEVVATLSETRECSLENAHGERVYRRAAARAQCHTEVQKANADFASAKAHLRQSMLAEKDGLCKRLQSLPDFAAAADGGNVRRSEGSFAFVERMERSGVIAVASTPDEINQDLNDIVHAGRVERLRRIVCSETDSDSSVDECRGEDG